MIHGTEGVQTFMRDTSNFAGSFGVSLICDHFPNLRFFDFSRWCPTLNYRIGEIGRFCKPYLTLTLRCKLLKICTLSSISKEKEVGRCLLNHTTVYVAILSFLGQNHQEKSSWPFSPYSSTAEPIIRLGWLRFTEAWENFDFGRLTAADDRSHVSYFLATKQLHCSLAAGSGRCAVAMISVVGITSPELRQGAGIKAFAANK